MPFCRECGGQVEATWKFCPHCNSEQDSNVVIGNDSVHVGDITVNKIDEESLKNSLKQIFDEKMAELAKIGFTKEPSLEEFTPNQKTETNQIFEIVEQMVENGIVIDPWDEIALGNTAMQDDKGHERAKEHYLNALELFVNDNDWKGEAVALQNLGFLEPVYSDEKKQLYLRSLAIFRENGDYSGEADALNKLGWTARTLEEEENWYRESLRIWRKAGDKEGESNTLYRIVLLLKRKGLDDDESKTMLSNAHKIRQEIGIPTPQWFWNLLG